MTPTLGDVVHFYPYIGAEPRAAIVTGLDHLGAPMLYVFPTAPFSYDSAPQHYTGVPGPERPAAGWYWTWRPRASPAAPRDVTDPAVARQFGFCAEPFPGSCELPAEVKDTR